MKLMFSILYIGSLDQGLGTYGSYDPCKNKVKLFLCLSITLQRHAGEVEVKLHTFLTSALDGVSGQFCALTSLL
jgi:hypothetical protein